MMMELMRTELLRGYNRNVGEVTLLSLFFY